MWDWNSWQLLATASVAYEGLLSVQDHENVKWKWNVFRINNQQKLLQMIMLNQSREAEIVIMIKIFFLLYFLIPVKF